MKKIYLLLLFMVASCMALNAQIRYVSQGGSGAKTGMSWIDASDNLQAMIDASATGDQIWVAKGTYLPTQNLAGSANEDKSFVLKSGVQIFGGFAGNEPTTYDLNTRDFVTNETILSGDFGGGVNSRHVVVNIDAISGVELNGFTISGGNANTTAASAPGTFSIGGNYGGGIFLNVSSGIKLTNLKLNNNLSTNFGGGIYLSYSGTGVVDIRNVTFLNNTANVRAGALYITRVGSSTAVVNINDSNFNGNGTNLGGSIFHNSGELSIFNTTFENCSGTNGGAINNGNTSSTVLLVSGCTFKNNSATNGAGIYNYTGTTTIENSLFEGNVTSARGAGIYLNNGALKLSNSKFNVNNADSDGGGIYRYGGSALDIDNSIFSNNVSGANAGAIKVIFGTSKINNSVFYNNSAQDGGAMYVGNSAGTSAAVLVATNNTFYNNTDVTTAGVISFLNTSGRADIRLYNNILVNNASTNGAADIRMTAQESSSATQNIPIVLTNNLLQSTLVSDGNLTVADNLVYNSALPLFASVVETDINFLHLVEGQATEKGSNSLATDAGILNGVDLAGNLRRQHDNIDLGAYEYQGVLPVVFDYFNAKKVGATANLTWATVSESNNSHFIIERGTSANNFTYLAKVTASGNSNTPNKYSYMDSNPMQGANYYRLTQYDFNGDHKMLAEQVLTFNLSNAENLVYPNPARSEVAVKLNGLNSGLAKIDLISMLGQQVLSKDYGISADGEVNIDLSVVPAGTYILWINKGKANSDKKTLLVVK